MGCSSANLQLSNAVDSRGAGDAQGDSADLVQAEECNDEGTDQASSARRWCSRCERATRVCICGHLPEAPVDTQTRVLVLIHPKETRRACGTVPLLRLCLRNLRVLCGSSFGETCEEAPEELLQELGNLDQPPERRRPAFLVAPGPSALVLQHRGRGCICGSETPAGEAEGRLGAAGSGGPLPGAVDRKAASEQLCLAGRGCTLVFVDGTWRLAKQMIYRTPWLQSLPRVCLEPEEESRYAFRRQPSKDCVSTLEAVAECLMALEPDTAKAAEVHASLHAVMDAMVARQLAFIREGSRQPEHRPELAAATPALPIARARQLAAGATSTYCLVRYERGAGGIVRRAVVEETLRRCAYGEAVATARELSATRGKEGRLHVVPLEKVKRTKAAGGLTFVLEGQAR